MKSRLLNITILFVLIFVFQNAKAQVNLSQKISINAKNRPLTQVLKIIEQENDFYFAYNPKHFVEEKIISVNKENISIKNILNEILESRFSYKTIGNHIILNLKSHTPVNQQYTITGTILNENNLPIDSVIIYAVKDKRVVITDKNGSYTISLQKRPQYINISHPYFNDTLILADNIEKGIIIQLQKTERIDDSIAISKLDIKYPEIKPIETIFENIKLVKQFVPQEAVYIAKQIKTRELTPVQLSFLPGLGTNSLLRGLRTNCFSINALVGYSKGLYGLEMGGLANIIQENVIGVQFAGLTNIVNGSTVGGQFSGILNYNLSYLDGVQLGGIGNINLRAVRGVQIAGVINIIKNNITGMQISGICNFASSTKGVQLSSIINISKENVFGIQASGVANKTKKLNGVQIGLVNIADSIETGVQLGLFNIVKNGYRAFELTSTETFIFDFLYKTGGKKLYSTLNIGIDKNQFGAGYGIGFMQPIFTKLSASIDGIHTLILSTRTKNVYQGKKTSIRIALNYDFLKHLGIKTGISFNMFNPHNSDKKNTMLNGLSFKGNSNKLISKSIDTNKGVIWIGWFMGIRF